MDSAKDKQLTWPQKNWLLLCILVAILSPMITNRIRAGAQRESYKESTHKASTEPDTNAKNIARDSGAREGGK